MWSLTRYFRRRRLAQRLIQAEAEARLRDKQSELEEPAKCPSGSLEGTMTEIDMVRYRRIIAKLHYGEDTANPEYEALLTQGERDYLDAYVIQQRWGLFWARLDHDRYSA